MSQKALHKPTIRAIAFTAFAIGLFLLLNLIDFLHLRPQSIHQWRQTVCLNITLNYAEQNNGFLQTETNLLNADQETTGIAMGEFPLFYYLMGKAWQVIGPSEFLYRTTTLLLFISALFAIYKALYRETENFMSSAFLSLIFIVLPVTAYYSVSFLMDGVALSTLILSWYCFYRAYKDRAAIWYILFFVLFTLTGLFKVTLLISVIALLVVSISSWLFPQLIQIKNKHWVVPTIVLLMVAITFNILWYAYAISYNNQHGGWITENGIYPIWELTQEKWAIVFDWVKSYWYKQYAPPWFYILFLFTLISFLKAKAKIKEHRFLAVLTLVTFMGTLTYVLLWIQVFDHHDYYVFAIYPLFFGLVLLGFVSTWQSLTQIGQRVFTAFLGGILLISAVYTGKQLHFRLNGWPNGNGQNEFQAYFDITPYLRNKIGIDRTEKIVAYPDQSVCISLYLADQKGWQMNAEQDTSFLNSKIEKGASYVLVNDSSFYKIQGIEDIGLIQIGRHKGIDVLKVQKTQDAF